MTDIVEDPMAGVAGVCLLCFEKTEISETEEGELLICEKCKDERIEMEVLSTSGTEFEKDGMVIEGFKEVLVEEPENIDQSEDNIADYLQYDGDDACLIYQSQTFVTDKYCRSCKIFYSRFCDTSLVCITGRNDCEITEISRINCRSCRFNKCVTQGMEQILGGRDETERFVKSNEDRMEGQIKTEAVVGKDGKVIRGFEEVHQEEPENNIADIAIVPDAAELIHQKSQGFKTCEVCQSKHQVWKQKHCQSCRCFFRRVWNKPLSCITGGNDCEITEITRTNCKSCRYKRCVAVGMMKMMKHVHQGSKIQIHFESQTKIAEVSKKSPLTAEGNNMPLRRKSEESIYRKDNLIPCAICGSLEVAHKNYGVDCCKSCKIFFLRQTERDGNRACVAGTNNCTVTKVNRTNCKSCRYKRCIAAGFPSNMKNLQKRENQQKRKQTANVTKDKKESKPQNASNERIVLLSKREPDQVYWMQAKGPEQTAEDNFLKQEPRSPDKDEVGPKVNIKKETEYEPVGFELVNFKTTDPIIVKSELEAHDNTKNEQDNINNMKIEPLESILHYDPLADNIEDVQMNELVIKSIETDHSTIATSKSTIKITRKVKDPLDTSKRKKSKMKRYLKAEERDPLDTSLASCHICQAEAPGQLFYGGICCYSCRIFFRRSVGSVFNCSKRKDECMITKATRTQCKKCRYQRCLDVGMKPQLVDRNLSKRTSHEDRDGTVS